MDDLPVSSSYKGIVHLQLIEFLTEFEYYAEIDTPIGDYK